MEIFPIIPVSYTHLDVYKRQAPETERSGGSRFGDIHISVGKVDGDNVTEIVREMASQLQKAIAQYAG